MKTILCYTALCFVFVLTGCKGETPIDDLPLVTPKKYNSNVEVVLDMVVVEDDTFELFYAQDDAFTLGQFSIREKVNGSDRSQQIVFNLNDTTHLTSLRIDIGENISQKKMIINNLMIKSFGKKLEIKGSDFFNYFSPGGNVEIDGIKSSIKTIVPDEVPYDPIFFPKPSLNEALKKLY